MRKPVAGVTVRTFDRARPYITGGRALQRQVIIGHGERDFSASVAMSRL